MKSNAERIGEVIDRYGESNLRTLEWLGGRNLRVLGRTIWMGFGLHPGDDAGIAQFLSVLPMRAAPIPTFVYTRLYITRPLFEFSQNPAKCVSWPVPVHLDGNEYQPTRIRRTAGIDALLDGAVAIHKSMGVHEDRGRILLHLVQATILTARQKGLEW